MAWALPTNLEGLGTGSRMAPRGIGRRARSPEPPAQPKRNRLPQPSGPHRRWHTDISYVNLGGTFYYCGPAASALRECAGS
jgi:hypothetical protein